MTLFQLKTLYAVELDGKVLMNAEYTRVYPKVPDWPPGTITINSTALCH